MAININTLPPHTHTHVQSNQATEQRQSYETELLVLKTQLENEEYKRAIASSDMEHKINVLGQEKAELNRDIDAKVIQCY